MLIQYSYVHSCLQIIALVSPVSFLGLTFSILSNNCHKITNAGPCDTWQSPPSFLRVEIISQRSHHTPFSICVPVAETLFKQLSHTDTGIHEKYQSTGDKRTPSLHLTMASQKFPQPLLAYTIRGLRELPKPTPYSYSSEGMHVCHSGPKHYSGKQILSIRNVSCLSC